MSAGVKNEVAAALAQAEQAADGTAKPKRQVMVSGDAQREYSQMARLWSGWPDLTLEFGETGEAMSDVAWTDRTKHIIRVDPAQVLLNPENVLTRVTPFRMRQEAVLTGSVLHECGHARHSDWIPGTEEQAQARPLLHGDGSVPTAQVVDFAILLEEPRVEGLMARDSYSNGAGGLEWTMRASAAKLLPFTDVSSDPMQQVMDVTRSWILRAGRQIALHNHRVIGSLPQWVQEFTTLLSEVLVGHLGMVALSPDLKKPVNPMADTARIVQLMTQASVCTDDTGSTMIDLSKEILDLMFPETDGDGGGGGGAGVSIGSSCPSKGEGEGDPNEQKPESLPEDSPLQQQMKEAESKAEKGEAEQAADQQSKAPTDPQGGGLDGGTGGQNLPPNVRPPTKAERQTARDAESFLRRLINPSETAVTRITDTPSSQIDGAAYEQWNATGRTRAPHFFKESRRTISPQPPVRIAQLVDVSGSMDVLQKPSALMSWALSMAAMNMRNFAGRGTVMETCLIHWGSTARVIQETNIPMAGIYEVRCAEGTNALDEAMLLIEQQMPGFFDVTDKPVNRLIVQYTDWRLNGYSDEPAQEQVVRALNAGVNMLSVVPSGYSPRAASLGRIVEAAGNTPGSTALLKYDPRFPDQVWDKATELLNMKKEK